MPKLHQVDCTNRQLRDIIKPKLDGLKSIPGVRIAHAVSRNLTIIQPLLDALVEASKPSDEFIEFDRKRGELAEKLADRDENGQVKVVRMGPRSTFVIIERRAEFDEQVEVLKLEYGNAIEARDRQLQDFEKLLDDPTSFNAYRIKFSFLPETITAGQIDHLDWMFIDDLDDEE